MPINHTTEEYKFHNAYIKILSQQQKPTYEKIKQEFSKLNLKTIAIDFVSEFYLEIKETSEIINKYVKTNDIFTLIKDYENSSAYKKMITTINTNLKTKIKLTAQETNEWDDFFQVKTKIKEVINKITTLQQFKNSLLFEKGKLDLVIRFKYGEWTTEHVKNKKVINTEISRQEIINKIIFMLKAKNDKLTSNNNFTTASFNENETDSSLVDKCNNEIKPEIIKSNISKCTIS